MSWIIYKHTSPSGKVYIGQTRQLPSERWKNGLGYYSKGNTSVFYNAIKKYGWDNITHEVIEDGIKTKEKANEREQYWIKFHNAYIGFTKSNGYNMTLGGSNRENLGYPVYQIDKRTYEIIKEFPSTAEASRYFNNSICNSSTIRLCCEGKKVSCKGYYWCYVKNYSDDWTPKASELVSPVYQLDDNLEIIQRYDSITKANSINGFSIGSIVCCCLRKTRKACGYYWCYENDYSSDWKPAEVSFNRNEKIYCFETDTVYNSAKDASRATGANAGHLHRVCKGLENASNGFHFCFARNKESYLIKSNKDESPVVCINTKKHYKTIVEASTDTGCSQSCISACCRGKMKTSNGLTWCYEKDFTEDKSLNKRPEKRIICIDTGKIYESIGQICKELNLSRGNIGYALKYHYPANKLFFAYYDSYDCSTWKPRQNKCKKRIVCIETNTEYESAVIAEQETGVKKSNISRSLRTGGTAGGFHWKFS